MYLFIVILDISLFLLFLQGGFLTGSEDYKILSSSRREVSKVAQVCKRMQIHQHLIEADLKCHPIVITL